MRFFNRTNPNQPILGANNEIMRLVNTLHEDAMRVQAQQALNEADFAFNRALTNLRNQMPQPHVANILTESIDNLIEEVIALRLKGKEPIDCLTEALEATAERLNGRMTEAEYENIAKKMQGHVSAGIRILGAALNGVALILGLVAVAICLCLFAIIPAVFEDVFEDVIRRLSDSIFDRLSMILFPSKALAKKMNQLNINIEQNAQSHPQTSVTTQTGERNRTSQNGDSLLPTYEEATRLQNDHNLTH